MINMIFIIITNIFYDLIIITNVSDEQVDVHSIVLEEGGVKLALTVIITIIIIIINFVIIIFITIMI